MKLIRNLFSRKTRPARLGLEQYAIHLESRGLPAPPAPAEPSSSTEDAPRQLKDIKAVTWSLYGSLLLIEQGELLQQYPDPARMAQAFDQTIEQFRMWQSMSRKPGPPSEYMESLYLKALSGQHVVAQQSGQHVPEVSSAALWQTVIKRLQKNEYTWDVAYYGDLQQYSEKVAYFFHRSLQGVAPRQDALDTMRWLAKHRVKQGIVADGQCFSPAQLLIQLRHQGEVRRLNELVPSPAIALSASLHKRKPAARLFRHVVKHFAASRIRPNQIVHLGSDMRTDVAGAKQCGMKTILIPHPGVTSHTEAKPDCVITSLQQLKQILV